MTPLLQNQPDIDLGSQFSFAQALKLTRSSVSERGLEAIYDASKTDEGFETELDKIGNSLDRLQVSINTYSSLSLLQKIKGIFDGTLIKIWVLKKAMSTVTKVVHRQLWELYALDEIPEVAFAKSGIKPSNYSQSFRDTKANAIARKYSVLNAIHQTFLKANPNETSWNETAKEVNEFFIGKLTTLNTGQNTTVPRFYHATGCRNEESWKLIIQSKKIMQTKAALGFGAYVSTGDESHYGYGPYTFGLTHHAVYRHKASYYHGTSNHMWVRVEHDIELSEHTVSHFVCKDKATCQSSYEMFVTDFGFSVPVFSRAANDEIIRLFNQRITQRPLSRKWRRMLGHSFTSIPAAMKPYSSKIDQQFNKCFA